MLAAEARTQYANISSLSFEGTLSTSLRGYILLTPEMDKKSVEHAYKVIIISKALTTRTV